MAADDQQMTDELVLRDLPGKLGILVVSIATLALGLEVWGVLFRFGLFPLAAVDLSDLLGVALFTIGWFGIVSGLLVLQKRCDAAHR